MDDFDVHLLDLMYNNIYIYMYVIIPVCMQLHA